MSSKPTLIFVHGAWHGPECWSKITPDLESEGYKCITEQLKFTGPEATPGVGVESSIRQVADLIEGEASRGIDVVVVNHSFGGTMGSSAVKGFTKKDSSRLKEGDGQVVGLVQLSAFLAPADTALMDMVGSRDDAFHYDDKDGFEKFKPGKDMVDIFYTLCSDEEKARLSKMFKPLASATFDSPEGAKGVYPGYFDVPSRYLRCTEDRAVPVQLQDEMIRSVREAGADVTVKSLASDHCPFYCKPKETAAFIDEAAQAFTG